MIRIFDILFSTLGLILSSPLLAILAILIWIENRSPLFLQQRIGRQQNVFTLVKFRTMQVNTPSMATHLADGSAVTNFGRLLRRTKLDELPQLWNVLKGEMSLVGPRPCLPSQEQLIYERVCRGVFAVRPGITGLAQINEIDMSTPDLLAEIDARMIQTLTLHAYFAYILNTILGKGSGDRLKN